MTQVISRKIINLISLAGLIATISLTIYFYHLGIFKDLTQLQLTLGKATIFAPVVFILIQVLQVIVPFIPGSISLAAGVIIFGPWQGFLYNYIGIVLGSMINFQLARHYGKPLIQSLISEKTYKKYIGYIDNQKRFDKFFAAAIFFPIAPDDALCLIAGLTKMSFKRFSTIILLAKPLTISMYSYGLIYGGQWLAQLLHH
ncbi:TVP38/TMEM64 family protein [Enterococcus nangangensis]|uniref:TVP38/TMEM64 family protein n=1 Tax=Enterococcus nangangensis TaxID=2559926 RepID=UPI0010F5E8C7|nr:TVP38/TMEM64 family protein [Enterococcus nangangensis]